MLQLWPLAAGAAYRLNQLRYWLIGYARVSKADGAQSLDLRVLTGQGAQIDTTTAAGRLVFGIFAALAEFERELTRERTLAGLTAARARGRKRRQDVRAVEGPGAAGPGRNGAP